MEGCFMFQWGGVVFQMGGFIFKVGGAPWGASVLVGGFEMGGVPPMPPHYGKPCNDLSIQPVEFS